MEIFSNDQYTPIEQSYDQDYNYTYYQLQIHPDKTVFLKVFCYM